MTNEFNGFSASLSKAEDEDGDWLTQSPRRNPNEFYWSSIGSISGKPSPNIYDQPFIPKDSWTHLSIDAPHPKDETIRMRVSELHVRRSGKNFGGSTVIVDMDHNSARQLLAWLMAALDEQVAQ